MAALSDLLAYIDSTKRTVGKRLSDLYHNPADYLDMVAANVPQAVQEFIDDPSNFIGGGLGKIVWHGSPHKFTKFDMSKIGTGEGAQAYGHGLYMAEAPEVAQGYAKALTDGRVLGARSSLKKTSGDADKGIEAAQKEIARLQALNLTPETGSAKRDSLIARQEQIIAELNAYKNSGNLSQEQLYKVDIPDEAVARMLDYDRLLSEQPEVLAALNNQKILDAINARRPDGWSRRSSIPEHLTGQQFLASEFGMGSGLVNESAATSKALRDAGIPGIRYLDGGSRSAGQGSSNFVLFDDQLPRILEINSVPTGNVPWELGEWNKLRDLLAQ